MRNLGMALCEALVFSRGNDCLLHEIWHAIAERDRAVGNSGFNLNQIRILRDAWLTGRIKSKGE